MADVCCENEPNVLEVADLQFSYAGHQVFSGVHFQLKTGKLYGLFGPNGCGKSTLMKCCLSLLKSTGGSVHIAGKDTKNLATSALAKLVAYVPQDHNPPFPFLVREVVLMGCAPHFGGVFGLKKQHVDIAAAALERLGISHLGDKVYTQLSGGQRQLVLIARAIAQQTPFIMLDEPTSALDFRNQLLVWRILKDIAASGTTVFACAHDPNHVSWFCDALLVMNHGTIQQSGCPQATLNQELLQELYGDVCAVGDISGLRMIYPTQAQALVA